MKMFDHKILKKTLKLLPILRDFLKTFRVACGKLKAKHVC